MTTFPERLRSLHARMPERTAVCLQFSGKEDLPITYDALVRGASAYARALAQEGILISYRGPNGGVALARSADRITLREIVTAIDGEELFFECLLGLPGCGEQRPCPLHQWWAAVRTELSQVFAGTTVAELRDKVTRFDLRLAP